MSRSLPHRRALASTPKPLVFQILLVLLEGNRHGYGIVKEVEARTQAQVEPGNLYRTLRTMLSQGLISESPRRPDPQLDDQRRRYFDITDLGLAVARAEAARLQELVAQARAQNLLPDSHPAS